MHIITNTNVCAVGLGKFPLFGNGAEFSLYCTYGGGLAYETTTENGVTIHILKVDKTTGEAPNNTNKVLIKSDAATGSNVFAIQPGEVLYVAPASNLNGIYPICLLDVGDNLITQLGSQTFNSEITRTLQNTALIAQMTGMGLIEGTTIGQTVKVALTKDALKKIKDLTSVAGKTEIFAGQTKRKRNM